MALVGRSNVGKSLLINALTDRQIARTGAKPGTTRLVNIYRVRVSVSVRMRPLDFTLADLPGYGFARGGNETRRGFENLTREFFDHAVVGRTPTKPETRTFRLAGSMGRGPRKRRSLPGRSTRWPAPVLAAARATQWASGREDATATWPASPWASARAPSAEAKPLSVRKRAATPEASR